ncbi:hypothetical protein [Infirmifilum sp. SLHALR2]
MAGEKRSPVYEEALMQELAYAIAHIAHAEQHLLEIDSQLSEPKLAQRIDKLRMSRKALGEVLLEVAGLRGHGGGGEERSAAESLWCTLKHLSMAIVHCDECAEKVTRRLVEKASAGDVSGARELLAQLSKIYATRREALGILMELLRGEELRGESVEAVRCREDLCVE